MNTLIFVLILMVLLAASAPVRARDANRDAIHRIESENKAQEKRWADAMKLSGAARAEALQRYFYYLPRRWETGP